MSTASEKAAFSTISGSFFAPFSRHTKKTTNLHKRSIWRLWRPNDPQSDPRGSPKGGQNPSKIGTKSSLSRRGRPPATFDLKKWYRGRAHPKIYRKSTEKLAKLDEILAECGYPLLLQNSKQKNGGRSALHFLLSNVCSFTNGNGELHTATQMTPCLTPCKNKKRAP